MQETLGRGYSLFSSFSPTSPHASSTMSDAPGSSSAATGRRSKICSVCGCEAETYHLNYGVSACFSCRAFFRRSVTKSSSPRLQCKKDANCSVTFETRRNCPGCRYQKCLRVGMNPQAVMDDSAKKVRFRKVLKKVEELEGRPGDRLKFPRRNNSTNVRRTRQSSRTSQSPGTSREFDDDNGSSGESISLNTSRNSLDYQSEEEVSSDLSMRMTRPDSTSNLGSSIQNWTSDESSSMPEVSATRFNCDIQGTSRVTDIPPEIQNTHENATFRKPHRMSLRKAVPKKRLFLDPDHYRQNEHEMLLPYPREEELFSPYSCPDVDNDIPDIPFCSNLESHTRRKTKNILHHLKKTWSRACLKVQIDSEFKNNLIAFHLGYKTLSKDLLKRHLMTIGRLFRDYALSQPGFVKLSKDDQRRLLGRNTPLFIHYILAKYLIASSGEEQLDWLLVSEVRPENELKEKLELINFEMLNVALQLFPCKSTNVQRYQELASTMNHPLLQTQFNHLVAMACLYNTRFYSSSFLDDPIGVGKRFEMALEVADMAHEAFSPNPPSDILKQVLLTADQLSSIFEESVDWEVMEEIRNELRREVTLFNTHEENDWLMTKLDQFTSEFTSVPLGENTLKDLVMLSFDVPPSSNFVQSLTLVVFERCRRIQMTHQPFRDLTTFEKNRLLMQNARTFSAVMSLRSQSMPTGFLQVKLLSGTKDHRILEERYNEITDDGKKLKKLTLNSINNSSGGNYLTRELAEKFDSIVISLMGLVKDLTSYKLLSLVVALDSSCLSAPNQSLMELQEVYKRQLFRRVRETHTNTEIHKVFHNLEEMSKIIKLLEENDMNSLSS